MINKAVERIELINRMKKSGINLDFTKQFDREVLLRTCEKVSKFEKTVYMNFYSIQLELIKNDKFVQLLDSLYKKVPSNSLNDLLTNLNGQELSITEYSSKKILAALKSNIQTKQRIDFLKLYHGEEEDTKMQIALNNIRCY